jgi:hypothetical protein
MGGRPDPGSSTNAPLPPPPPAVPPTPVTFEPTAVRGRVYWTTGRKVLATVLLVALAAFGIVALLAFNSHRQTTAARERYAGVYENRLGTEIVLRANGDYDLEGYEMEGIAGEWEVWENRTIPIGAFEPTELFIPYSQEVGDDGSRTGWAYHISPDGRTLVEEDENGVLSDDPLDRFTRTKDL